MWNQLGWTAKCVFRCHSSKRVLALGQKCFLSNQNTETMAGTEGTIQELKERLIQVMGIDKEFHPLGLSHLGGRQHLNQYLPNNQEELPKRTMSDSYVSALIPLSSDRQLREMYITFHGRTRIGRLLEDMDIFAVYVAHRHTFIPKKPKDVPTPYTLVTVSVDKIVFTEHRPTPNEDIRLSGHVSWVGKSSFEVSVKLEQKLNGEWTTEVKALFLMAARDTLAEKAAIVNALEVTNEEERDILKEAEIRRKEKRDLEGQQLMRVIPTENEQKMIHELFVKTIGSNEISLMRTKGLPDGCVWMESASLSNLIYSHPENRNLHNAVFGGFIMRKAMELSWALGFLFSKQQPTIKVISDISFNKRIAVGSLIRMIAYVAYTEKRYCQMIIYAEAIDSLTAKDITSNIFHFTYEMPEDNPLMFPKSYQEAMTNIDARRKFLLASNLNIENIRIIQK